MRILKRIILSLLGILVLSIVGGYLYFDAKFTPSENYLTLSESSGNIPIQWLASKESEMAVLLLPIKIKGVDHPFYMQFDTGSPTTLFRKNRLIDIQKKYPMAEMVMDTAVNTISTSFNLGTMSISSSEFEVLNRGSAPIDWNDTTGKYVIGTIGADLIEKKISVIDFKRSICNFSEILPANYDVPQWYPLILEKRRTLFPARIGESTGNLMHDTGTSGFELITSKEIWTQLAKKGAEPKTAFTVRSWDNILTAYDIESEEVIAFDMIDIDLNKVTYIEGAAFWQVALMRILGMGGMIGNEVFKDKVLIMDCKNEQYVILQ